MMRVQIRDKEALGSLTPENLRAYLESQGWGNDRPWGQWGTILSKEQKGKLWEIVIPLRDEGYGYAEFMGLMVATLADAEERSQLDVFYDLANPTVGTVSKSNRNGDKEMTSVWCVRADNGKYTQHFVNGGYIGFGWDWPDLTTCKDQNEVRQKLAVEVFDQDTDLSIVGQYAGMASLMMWKMQAGDWVITPEEDARFLRYGKVEQGGCSYIPNALELDGCPDTLRRGIAWEEQILDRSNLSPPFQRTMKHAQRSVFAVSHRNEFLVAIGPHHNKLDKLLKINETEFEMLVSTALKHKGWRIAK